MPKSANNDKNQYKTRLNRLSSLESKAKQIETGGVDRWQPTHRPAGNPVSGRLRNPTVELTDRWRAVG